MHEWELNRKFSNKTWYGGCGNLNPALQLKETNMALALVNQSKNTGFGFEIDISTTYNTITDFLI